MLKNETELTLLSAWTLKYHSEDMKLFEPQIFTRQSWLDALLKGKNHSQIRSLNLLEGMTLTDLQKNANHFYTDSKLDALTEQRNFYMERAKREDSQLYLDKARETQAVIDGNETVPNATHLKETFFKEFEAEKEEKNPHYGFKKLDDATRGLHKGQLITLGARLGVGKSAFGMQLAHNISMQDYKVIYCPLEMSNYQMLKRLLLTSGTVVKEELYGANDYIIKQIGTYLDRVEMCGQLILCENLNTISGIKQKIQEERPEVVIIDQLSLLYPTEKYSSIRERYIANTRELKRLALEEKVAIVLLAQLNREANSGAIPTVENLSESDSIGQDSDIVLLMWRSEPEGDYERQLVEKRHLTKTSLRIAKQREGISGVNILYWYDGSNYQFSEAK